MEHRFPCGTIAPMMWALVALSGIELIVVHALVAHWWPWVAATLSVVSLAAIGWLIYAIRSLTRRPSVVAPDFVTLRAGVLKGIEVPPASIVDIRTTGWSADDLKGRHVLNLAMVAYPNVWVDLSPSVAMGRRRIAAVAHRLDDADGFVAACRALGRADGH